MKEIWKQIPNFKNGYKVSSLGRVKNKNGKLLKISRDFDGYEHVLGKSVHRLVASAFIDNPHQYPFVNHKDKVRNNNNAINLEWCTRQYNATYSGKKVVLFNSQLEVFCPSIAEAARWIILHENINATVSALGVQLSKICKMYQDKKYSKFLIGTASIYHAKFIEE